MKPEPGLVVWYAPPDVRAWPAVVQGRTGSPAKWTLRRLGSAASNSSAPMPRVSDALVSEMKDFAGNLNLAFAASGAEMAVACAHALELGRTKAPAAQRAVLRAPSFDAFVKALRPPDDERPTKCARLALGSECEFDSLPALEAEQALLHCSRCDDWVRDQQVRVNAAQKSQHEAAAKLEAARQSVRRTEDEVVRNTAEEKRLLREVEAARKKIAKAKKLRLDAQQSEKASQDAFRAVEAKLHVENDEFNRRVMNILGAVALLEKMDLTPNFKFRSASASANAVTSTDPFVRIIQAPSKNSVPPNTPVRPNE